MHRAFLLLAGCLACSRPAPTGAVTLAQSPSSAPAASASGSLLASPALAISDREIAHGVVVDLRARKEIRVLLTDDDVWNDADDGAHAYEHVRADSVHRMKDEIRAYDLATGAELWRQYVGRCYAMAAAPAGLFCDSDKSGEIVLLDRATGASRAIPAPGITSNLSSIERVGSKVAVLTGSSQGAALFDAATGAPAGTLALPYDFRVARVRPDSICGVGFDPTSATVVCFDASPRVVWSKKIPLAAGELRMADDRDVLVTTRLWASSGTPESFVLSLDDGRTVAHVGSFVSSFVRDEHGAIAGFFRAGPTSEYLGLDGRSRWTTRALQSADSASALLADGVLVVAGWGQITAGAEIVGLDPATGATRWTGELPLLPIAHSAYRNDVTLRLHAGAVVMRGRESMQDYLALFDPATGNRFYATVRRR